jgi:hypothetical protein
VDDTVKRAKEEKVNTLYGYKNLKEFVASLKIPRSGSFLCIFPLLILFVLLWSPAL